MGKLELTIELANLERETFESLDVLVDTGATFTKAPATMLNRLGVMVERTAESELANGATVTREIGIAAIRLQGQEFLTPVIFGGHGERPLLGVIALEHALLAVDPVAGRLVPTRLLELQETVPQQKQPEGQDRCIAQPQPDERGLK